MAQASTTLWTHARCRANTLGACPSPLLHAAARLPPLRTRLHSLPPGKPQSSTSPTVGVIERPQTAPQQAVTPAAAAVSPAGQAPGAPAAPLPDRTSGYISLALVPLLWGTYNPCIRYLYAEADPLDPASLTAVRTVLSAGALLLPALLGYLYRQGRSAWRKHQDDQKRQQEALRSGSSTSIATASGGSVTDSAELDGQHAPLGVTLAAAADSVAAAAAAPAEGAGTTGTGPAAGATAAPGKKSLLSPALNTARLGPVITRTFDNVVLGGLELGLLNFLGTALQVEGLHSTSATRAGFLAEVTAVLTPLVSYLAGYEIPRQMWLAVGVGLVGSTMVAYDTSQASQPASTQGATVAGSAAASAAPAAAATASASAVGLQATTTTTPAVSAADDAAPSALLTTEAGPADGLGVLEPTGPSTPLAASADLPASPSGLTPGMDSEANTASAAVDAQLPSSSVSAFPAAEVLDGAAPAVLVPSPSGDLGPLPADLVPLPLDLPGPSSSVESLAAPALALADGMDPADALAAAARSVLEGATTSAGTSATDLGAAAAAVVTVTADAGAGAAADAVSAAAGAAAVAVTAVDGAAAAATATVATVAAGTPLEITGGEAYLLLACLFYSICTVRMGIYAPRMDTVGLAAMKKVGLSSMSVMWMAATNLQNGAALGSVFSFPDLSSRTPVGLAVLLYSGLGPGALATLLQVNGLSTVPATTAQVIYSMTPLCTAFFAYLILGGEATGPVAWAGGSLIIFAALMAADAQQKQYQQQLQQVQQQQQGPAPVVSDTGC